MGPVWSAFAWPVVIAGGVFALHALLPARQVEGYVRDSRGAPLRYRLNGPLVFAVSVAIWVAVCRAGWISWDAFYVHRWEMAAGGCALGVLFTLAVVLPAPRVPGWSLGKELYLGRVEQPLSRVPLFVRSGAIIPFYPEPVACTDEMDPSRRAELVFDYRYHGFRSSALGKHIDL